jgi:hypothetical protein
MTQERKIHRCRSHHGERRPARLLRRRPAGMNIAMPDVSIFAALFAGLISFLSPCVLPLVPPYLVYLAGTSLERLTDEDPATGSQRQPMPSRNRRCGARRCLRPACSWPAFPPCSLRSARARP